MRASLGVGPDGMQIGDNVCILYGLETPYIVRPVGKQGHYKLIGECFVNGIMYGEAFDMALTEQEFSIVRGDSG